MQDGELYVDSRLHFAFLGVYSGEYTWEEPVTKPDGSQGKVSHSYGLGNVWYSYLIPEIIENGIKLI